MGIGDRLRQVDEESGRRRAAAAEMVAADAAEHSRLIQRAKDLTRVTADEALELLLAEPARGRILFYGPGSWFTKPFRRQSPMFPGMSSSHYPVIERRLKGVIFDDDARFNDLLQATTYTVLSPTEKRVYKTSPGGVVEGANEGVEWPTFVALTALSLCPRKDSQSQPDLDLGLSTGLQDTLEGELAKWVTRARLGNWQS